MIITKLSEEDKLKRENKTKKASGRNKSRMDAERSDLWNSVNIYATNIDKVKKVNLHRFECFLYGKLISVVLNSIIVFKAKQYAYLKEKKYISIYKAFAIAKEYSCKTRDALLKTTKSFWALINEIIVLILKRGVKCKKKNTKMAEDILYLKYTFLGSQYT